MQRIRLSALLPGDRAVVVGTPEPNAVGQRLCEMGFVPGARVRLVRRAPFGDPIEIEIDRWHLALRAVEARSIEVEISA